MAEQAFARLLRDRDLQLLAGASGQPLDGDVALQQLRAEPGRIEALLRRPAFFETLFGGGERDPLLLASPFLVFATLVLRTASDLEGATFVEEWQGPNRRLPVFDVESLRAFLRQPRHRTLLAELLASYTRVASGTWWQRTERGWRRRRYSELDPV